MAKKIKLTATSFYDVGFRYERVYDDIEDYFPDDEVPDDRELVDFAIDELEGDFLREAVSVDIEVVDE